MGGRMSPSVSIPRFRPLLILAAVLAAAMAFTLAAAPAGAAPSKCRGAKMKPAKLTKLKAQKSVLCLINKKRRSRGMRPLSRNGKQMNAARKHNRLMVRKDCFAHQCPGERDLTGRMVNSDYLPCNCYWGVGENLAWGKRHEGTPQKVFKAWMHSYDHRVNILERSYEHIGIGIAWGTPTGDGKHDAVTYTTDFGYRK